MRLTAEQSRMVEENRGLVSVVLQRSRGLLMRGKDLGLERDDLFQYGVEGLCAAAARYTAGRGPFAPFAYPWIRGTIGRAIDNEGRLVRVPVNVLRDVPATTEEATEEIREAARRAQRPFVSWDDPAGPDGDDGEDVALEEVVPDPAALTEDDLIDGIDRPDRSADLRRALAEVLTPQEQQVLIARFGLEDGEPEKLAATCRRLGLNPGRVCEVERAALAKVRRRPDVMRRLRRVRGARITSASPGCRTPGRRAGATSPGGREGPR